MLRPKAWCAAAALWGAALSTTSPALADHHEGDEKMGASSEMGEVDKSVSEEDLKEARLHFSNGVDLIQQNPPNYQDAYYQFQLALEKSGGSWKVRGNLGFCALKLERDGEALEHYRLYLQQGGDEVDPVEREQIEKELLLLQGNLVNVNVSSTDPTAQILVQRQGSSAPAQAYALKEGKATMGLRAGSFTITAQHEGEALTWKTVLTPGKDANHVFDFEAAAAAAEAESTKPAPAPAPAPVEMRPSTLRVIGYITAGVGVLGLGGGVATGLIAQSEEDQAREGCLNNICPSSQEDNKDTAENMAMLANILFISGGVLTATGVTLAIVGGNEPKETGASLHLSPSVAPGGGGLFAHGTF